MLAETHPRDKRAQSVRAARRRRPGGAHAVGPLCPLSVRTPAHGLHICRAPPAAPPCCACAGGVGAMPTFGLSKVVPVVADADGRLVALAQAESLRDARGAAVKKRHVRLGQVLSTSMAGNDLLSSCLYTGGVVAQVAGPLAPVCLACLALLLFCYRAIYSEVVTAIPVNGGSYNGLLNVSPKRVAAVAAVLSMLTYIATAVVSGVDSMQYLAILWPGLDIRAATIILLAAFACLATLGVGESAFVAVAMFALHLSMMTVIIISSVVFAFKDSWVLFADNWRQPFPDIFNSTTGTLIVAGNAGTAIFFGYCLSALGITGFETAANFVEEMADNRTYVYTLRNLWILVSVFNPLLSLSAMMVVPMAVIYSHPSDLLAIVGFKAGGAGMQTFVCVDAVVVLAGAVLTSYVGVIGLFSRLSADGILPAFMRRLNTLRGTPHWTFLIFFLASTSLFLAIYSPTDTNAIVQLGGVYSISFLSVMAAFAVCNLLLKAQRADMPRLVIARPWGALCALRARARARARAVAAATTSHLPACHHLAVVTLGMVMVVTGLVGNIIIGPEILVWFIIYVLALGFVVVVMFNKANLLRIAIVAVQSAWSSTAQRRAQAAHDAELRAAHDATEQRKLESQQEGHENVVGLPAFIGESPDAHHKKKRKHRKGSIVGGFFDDEEDDFTDDDDGGNDTSAAAADSASAADGASTHGGTRVDLHVTSRESSGTMRAASLAALSGAGSPLATDGGADNGSAAGATPVVATALSGWLEKSRQGLSRASSTRKLLTTPASGGGGGGGSGAGSVGSPLGPASPIASSAVAVASPTSAGNGDSGFQASPTRADRPMSAIVLATMHAAAAAKRVGSPLHDSVGVIASHAAVSGATAADAPLASAGGGGAPDAVVRAPSPALRPLEIPHAGAGALAVIAANDPAAAAGAGVAAVPATPLSGGPPPGIGAASAPSAARATSALGSISGIMEEPELEPLELNDSSAAPRSTARRDAIVNVRPARTNKRARDGTRDIDPKSMRGRIIAWLKQRLNCARCARDCRAPRRCLRPASLPRSSTTPHFCLHA